MADQISEQNEPEVVIGSREQLLHLLAEASEIEHTLFRGAQFLPARMRAFLDFRVPRMLGFLAKDEKRAAGAN